MPNVRFPEIEEQILKYWEENRVFEKSLGKPPPRGEFIFYDGPPFATGLPHYGHILASTIKDVIPRYKTMRGYHVRRRWGWDCHGLPIENIIEQELGISGKKQIEERGIEEFNRACRESVLKYAAEWGKMVCRIARWVEFENSYKTMESSYMESVWWALRQLWDKKLIYEGRKVLLWCPRCEAPISNFEVAMDQSYEEVKEEAITVKFRVVSSKQVSSKLQLTTYNLPTYLLAWTTTPWTLPGNVALAVGTEIDYVVARVGGEHYILVKARLAVIGEGYEIVQEMKGKDLVGLEYEPLFKLTALKSKKAFKVYPADFVSTEEGTGIVHTAVVYGEEDYELGLKYKLPVVPLLDERGVFNEKAPELIRGKYFKDSETVLKDDLAQRGLLFKREMASHSYPFCWRCETVLFYNAIPAWFIKISKLKKKLLRLNEKINWYPEHLKHGRFQKGMAGAPDWNISRNRYWATPLPFWRCVLTPHNQIAGPGLVPGRGGAQGPALQLHAGQGAGCGNVVCIGSLKELQERALNYDEVYKSRALSEIDLHRPYIDGVKLRCEKCGGEMRRIPEVVDCWVESASMPFAELHYPFENEELFRKRYPADFVAEYIAQTRAWFYVMHVLGSTLFGKPPFRNVVTTGTILSETGEKLSKSKRNFPDPWEVISKYGVDSLRLYLMTSPVMQADNLFFAERQVDEVYKKVVLLTLNVVSFYKLYAPSSRHSEEPRGDEESHTIKQGMGSFANAQDDILRIPNSQHVLDKWIIARLQETIREMTTHLDAYDTVRAGRLIPAFVDDLSTWYLRRSRERFKSKKKRERNAALYTTHYVLATFSKLIAPFMPFLAEHIYLSFRHSEEPRGDEESHTTKQGMGSFANAQDDKNGSVHLQEWPKFKKAKIDTTLLEEMHMVRKIVELAHAARAEAGIRVRQPLSMLQVTGYRLHDELLKVIAGEVNVKRVEVGGGKREVGGADTASGWLTKTEGTLTVALNTTITPELQKEGLLRELVRNINEARKIKGLTPSQTVHVTVVSTNPALREIIKEFQQQLRKSVIAGSVKLADAPEQADLAYEVALDQGEKLWIGFKKR